MDDGLAEHDPNRVIKESEHSGVTPQFLGGTSQGGDAPITTRDGQKQTSKNTEAEDNLRKAEEGAAGNVNKVKDDLKDTKENEEGAGGFYSGNKAESGGLKKGKTKKGLKGKLLKSGPMASIILSVFLIGGFMGGTQLFQPFSILAQFVETFNSMHYSSNMRSNYLLRLQMNKKREKTSKTKADLFDNTEDGTKTFEPTKYQQEELKAQGIEYDGESDTRVFKFQDDNNTVKTVYVGEGGGGDMSYETAMVKEDNFRHGYVEGSESWRGNKANMDVDSTNQFIKNNNLSRNTFDDFAEKVKQSESGDPEVVMKETIAEKTDVVRNEGVGVKEKDENDATFTRTTDEDGNEVIQKEVTEYEYESSNMTPEGAPDDIKNLPPEERYGILDEATGTHGYTVDENGKVSKGGTDSSFNRKTDADAGSIRGRLGKIGDTFKKSASIACAVQNLAGSISIMVMAAEALQIIGITTTFFESIDKVKSGDGEDSPLHVFANAINTPKDEKYVGVGSVDISSSNPEATIQEGKTEETHGSAVQSEGIESLYDGTIVNPGDPSVKSFNLLGGMKTLLGGAELSTAAFASCALARIAAAVTEVVQDGLAIFGCIASVVATVFTYGMAAGWAGFSCGQIVKNLIIGFALSAAIGIVIAAVIEAITPVVVDMLKRDLVENLGGESLGNAITSGALMYQGGAHRANGGSLTTINKYTEFALAQQKVIAEDARHERETLSPFDLTSKNTFMGTIMTQMMKFASSNSFMGTLMAGTTALSSSVLSLTPVSNAYDITKTLPESIEDYERTCPYLSSIGAIGDSFCNPYIITDVSTIEMDPVDVLDKLNEYNSFKGTTKSGDVDNVVIDEDSELADFLEKCNIRESAFGIPDYGIASDYMDAGVTGDSVADATIGSSPFFGDMFDIVNNSSALAHIGYISGESCVAGNDIQSHQEGYQTASESHSWESGEIKVKYFQRFAEDQGWAEQVGLIEKSAVAAYLEDYYEKNPLDESFEGMMARRTGLPKETIVALLDVVEYGQYIANYHPEERYAFGAPVVEEDNTLKYDNENVLAGDVVLLNTIAFSDVRNRTFAV